MMESGPDSGEEGARLKSGVIGPWGLAALAIGITSPAMGLFALWGPMQTVAGPVSPLIFLTALVMILPTAISYATLNREAPSAGAAASWLWEAGSPAVGYLVGLAMMTYFLMVSISMPLLFGLFFHDFLRWLGISTTDCVAVAVGALIEILIVGRICLRGAESSIRSTVMLMIAETMVVLALSATILWHLWNLPGGVNLSPFNPSNVTHGVSGFWAGLILGVLAFCGFDVVSTAAEEAKAPRDKVPQAILLTVTAIAGFWAVNAWVLTLSVPHADLIQFSSQGLTAITPVAQRYWGIGNIAVIMTAFTGLIAVYISCVLGTSRIMFALSRHRLLPASLARLDGERRVPVVAILLVLMLSGLLGALSLLIFPHALAAFTWWSNSLVFFAILTFIGVNAANISLFWRKRREKFNPIANFIIPTSGFFLNVYLIYTAFFSSLWSRDFATGKSIVLFCVAILILQMFAALAVRTIWPSRLSGVPPVIVDR